MAGLVDFLERLLEGGEIVFRARPVAEKEDAPATERFLRDVHRECSLEIAGSPLPFQPGPALTAAELLRQACWFLVHRGEETEEVERCLAIGAPGLPADHLAADLTLRYLAQVHRRARALAPDDALTRLTANVLRRWPLSGVLADVAEAPLTPFDFGGHPGLELLYAERLAGNEKTEWLPAGRGFEVVELVLHERGKRRSALLRRGGDDGT